MRKTLQVLSLLCATVGLLSLSVAPAAAVEHHHTKKHRAHGTVHHSKATKSKKTKTSKKAPAKSSAMVKEAQVHLQNLGYYSGKADGVDGSKTKSAVKKFQLHNGLKVDGKIGSKTMAALKRADDGTHARNAANAPTLPGATKLDFYAEHPDFYGHVDQDYSNPLLLGPPTIPSRFARVDVQEKVENYGKSYDVTINDQPLFTTPDQPAVIGISRTFSMDNEDVVIFTSYRPYDNVCMYKHYLLSLNVDGSKMHEITNCTRAYQATMTNGSIFVVFPEDDDARVVGATWRYENDRLERL